MSKFGNIASDQSLLVEALRRRDQSALAELYTAYGSALNGIILRIVEDDAIASEVLQDVFIKIWNKIDLYDSSKGRLFTWMMQLARNTAKDRFKTKEYSHRQKTEPLEEHVSMVEREHHIISYIEDSGLRKLINSLREEESQVINLVFFKGFTHVDAAKKLSIPLGTVKSRLRMAVKNLKAILNK